MMGNESNYNTQYQQGNVAGLQNIFGLSAMAMEAAKLGMGQVPKSGGGNAYPSPQSQSGNDFSKWGHM